MLTIVSENLQPFDKRGKSALSGDDIALLNLIKEVEEKGVTHIDLNPGPLKKQKDKIISKIIKIIEDNSNLNIIIDSTDHEIIETAINCSNRKVIINSFSLEEQKLKKILPLASTYKTDIIGLVMTSTMIPKTLEEKFLIAEEMIAIAEQNGVDRSQIILDPVILPLGWEDGAICAKANIDFIKHLSSLFGPEIRTIVGLSNLTTKAAGGTGKGLLQGFYLSMLYQAGLNMVMMDVFNSQAMISIKFINALEGRCIFTFSEFSS